jgi:TRAP-type C4-dicarboxylate transport system permease small subunit
LEGKTLSVFDKILAVLLGIIIIAVTAQVVWRYIFNDSLSWTEELSRYIYAWLIFIGAAAAIGSESHINADIFSARLHGKSKRVLTSIHYILMIFVLSYLFYYGVKFVIGTQGSYSTALGVPMGIVVNTSLPIGCLIGIILCMNKMIKIIRCSNNINEVEDK